MTGVELFELLGELDESMVDAAEEPPKRRNVTYLPAALISFAACAAVLGILFIAPRGGMKANDAADFTGNVGGAEQNTGNAADANDSDGWTGDASPWGGAPENNAPQQSGGADMPQDAPGSGAATGDAGVADRPDAGGDASSDGATAEGVTGGETEDRLIEAVVVEAVDELIVAPAEGSPWYGKAERFVLTMTDAAPADMPADLAPGDRVLVECDTASMAELEDGVFELPAVWSVTRIDDA